MAARTSTPKPLTIGRPAALADISANAVRFYEREGSGVGWIRDESNVLQSALTCPRCSYVKQETMPTDACQFFYECENCKIVLRPLPGDCCVFCSFGSVKCRRCKRIELAGADEQRSARRASIQMPHR